MQLLTTISALLMLQLDCTVRYSIPTLDPAFKESFADCNESSASRRTRVGFPGVSKILGALVKFPNGPSPGR